MLALRLPKDLEERLEFMAKRTGRTKSFFAREAILDKIEELEDAFLLERAYAEDDGVRYSLAEVRARLEARDD
jgi:RHH-type transcriptional regulator, rel operon repressor / antitoxin RelB